MAKADTDSLREEVRVIGHELARADELLDRRGELVEQARAAGMTWRDIADLLGMTEGGLYKTQTAYRARVQSASSRKVS